MHAQDILLLGVKRSVIAFDKNTGRRLWCTEFPGGFGNEFVSVVADASRVYAHAFGKLYCLDLLSGRILWTDPLPGAGYGLGSLALSGGPATTSPPIMEMQRQQQAATATSVTIGT